MTSTIAKSAHLAADVEIEDPVHIGPGCLIACTRLGRYCFVNSDTKIFPDVTVGRFVSFARECQIGGTEHPLDHLSTSFYRISRQWFPEDPLSQKAEFYEESAVQEPVVIGNDVWLGAGCYVRRGVTIGDGAVIGAAAVVTSDVAPYEIVAGIPARRTRYRFDAPTRKALLAAKWWDRDPELIARLPLNNVSAALQMLAQES